MTVPEINSSIHEVVDAINNMCSLPIMTVLDNDFKNNGIELPILTSRVPSTLINFLIEELTPIANKIHYHKVSRDVTDGKYARLDVRFNTKHYRLPSDNSKLFFKMNQYLNKNVLKGSSYYDPFSHNLVTIFSPIMMSYLFKFMDLENWLRDNYTTYELGNDDYIKKLENLTEAGLLRLSSELFTKYKEDFILDSLMYRYLPTDLYY